MKKIISTFIIFSFFCGYSHAQNEEASPKITSTNPDFGDCNVDPDLSQITIKFDQDMQEGYSIPDLTNMPKIIGSPQWIDKRTLVVPVKLYSSKLYSLIFNSAKYQNFKNIKGTPLVPAELHFQTRAVSCVELNKKSYMELLKIFPERYSYGSIKGINWASLLESSKSELENSRTQVEFGLKLIKLLRSAEDPHMWVEIEGERYNTSQIRLPQRNFAETFVYGRLKGIKTSFAFGSMAGAIDSIGYISFRDWNTDLNNITFKSQNAPQNASIPLLTVIKELIKYPNIIIDVRQNQGGNEFFAKEFASLFIKDSVAYEKDRLYNDITGKFDKENVKWLIPSSKRVNYSGNIYVFSGPCVISSNESFILMMKQMPNVKVVGMKTYGSSGNPIPYQLPNDITIYLPSWQAFTMDDELIEGKGIQPDDEIIIPIENFQNKDALFEKMVWRINNNK